MYLNEAISPELICYFYNSRINVTEMFDKPRRESLTKFAIRKKIQVILVNFFDFLSQFFYHLVFSDIIGKTRDKGFLLMVGFMVRK